MKNEYENIRTSVFLSEIVHFKKLNDVTKFSYKYEG